MARARSGAQGSAGAPGPPARKLAAALAARALFVYCGHGAGEAWVGARALRRLPACAAALLMGCSSGRLAPAGAYEPAGPVLAYLLAGARPGPHRALLCPAASEHACCVAAGACCCWLYSARACARELRVGRALARPALMHPVESEPRRSEGSKGLLAPGACAPGTPR